MHSKPQKPIATVTEKSFFATWRFLGLPNINRIGPFNRHGTSSEKPNSSGSLLQPPEPVKPSTPPPSHFPPSSWENVKWHFLWVLVYPRNLQLPTFLGYVFKSLGFHGKYLVFLVEGQHRTLKKEGIWSRG